VIVSVCVHSWAARYNAGLLTKVTLKDVVFSFLSVCTESGKVAAGGLEVSVHVGHKTSVAFLL